jgi:hypothetical protein
MRGIPAPPSCACRACVPIAHVAAWLGHTDVSFTLRTYVHAQTGALELAARSFAPPAANSGLNTSHMRAVIPNDFS